MLGLGLGIKNLPIVEGGFSITSSFLLDGINEYFNLDSFLTPLAATTTGTWLWSGKIIDSTPSAVGNIISFGDSSALESIRVWITTAGKVYLFCRIAGSIKWRYETTTKVLNDNTFHTIALVQDGVAPALYIDGSVATLTSVTTTDETAWFADGTGLDNGRLGCLNFNSGGNSAFTNAYNIQAAFINTNLSAAQILDWDNDGLPKSAENEFGGNCKGFWNADNSGSTAEFTVTDSTNSLTSVSVNLEDADKTTETPY